ncbi:uncharacterized protein [Blastocystis hominis]|uniref:RING-type domain-containing protein n=1 Tax=Blastocystis hominis TaxID=12968 RepID=D8M1J2_BLAHO|nr:uncharacterized protein [Blastocystis hominis]CBK21931.2 unnamed protein product [Blastocystis hominis]|eukprot:XP_012895979.1 uncharacterized protein [Blastocystis hominis]
MLRSEINVRTAVVVGVYGENTVIYNHMVVDFGVPYEKNSYTAPIVKVDPFDNCMDITSNVTGKIGIIMRSTFDNCSLANQVFNINDKGAIGVVVMNNMCLSSYDYLQKMSDSDSVNYNYTIPVISVTCSTGMRRFTIFVSSHVVTAFSEIQYILLVILILLTLWGGLGVVYSLNQCAASYQKHRRQRFVGAIKKRHFKKKRVKDVEDLPTCSICLTEFQERDVIKTLRCKHFFHASCIDPWLLNEKAVCPVCRQGIFEIEEWNALEEGQSHDIDVAMSLVEEQRTCTFSNLFSFVLCLFIIGFPFALSIMK